MFKKGEVYEITREVTIPSKGTFAKGQRFEIIRTDHSQRMMRINYNGFNKDISLVDLESESDWIKLVSYTVESTVPKDPVKKVRPSFSIGRIYVLLARIELGKRTFGEGVELSFVGIDSRYLIFSHNGNEYAIADNDDAVLSSFADTGREEGGDKKEKLTIEKLAFEFDNRLCAMKKNNDLFVDAIGKALSGLKEQLANHIDFGGTPKEEKKEDPAKGMERGDLAEIHFNGNTFVRYFYKVSEGLCWFTEYKEVSVLTEKAAANYKDFTPLPKPKKFGLWLAIDPDGIHLNVSDTEMVIVSPGNVFDVNGERSCYFQIGDDIIGEGPRKFLVDKIGIGNQVEV